MSSIAEDDVMVDIKTFCPECGWDTETVPLSSLSYHDHPDLFAENLERVAMLGPDFETTSDFLAWAVDNYVPDRAFDAAWQTFMEAA